MRDSHNRIIDYARISITDRCNLRCVYCMPEDGVEKQRHEDILSYEDIIRICRALVGMGVEKFKITGGEPLVRRGATALVSSLKALPGVASVTMTTNGILLADAAKDLHAAGLDGVTVSIDTLTPESYRHVTRGGDVRLAQAGIDAALASGLAPVKINCVPMAGKNDFDLLGVAELARNRPLHVRFIEMMPIGMGAAFRPIEREQLRSVLQNAFGRLEPVSGPGGNGPARYYSLPGFCGTIGFIQTLDHAICSQCNRLRLTADGMLKTCLHMDRGVDLNPALASDDEGVLARLLEAAVRSKPPHHEFAKKHTAEQRHMSQIGG